MFAMLRVAAIIVFATCKVMTIAQEYKAFNYNDIHYHKNVSTDTDVKWHLDDEFEDGQLRVPDLVRKYQYRLEVYTVTTVDGFILELHRIPRGRNGNAHNTNKPVIFLMHGIFCSSSVWVLMGPDNGLAYILADAGFDVWMGNARGTTYSRRHTRLLPNSSPYWQFSWDEIGDIDLPTMIDYVLYRTGKPNLHYVGHGQGTTVFFVMTSLHPEYNEKIISMHGLAPIAYMERNRIKLLKYIAPFANRIETVASMFGMNEFITNNAILNWAGKKMCRDNNVFRPFCSSILFLLGGWNEAEFNKTMLPTILGHLPAGTSVRQLVHYAQLIQSKKFCRFDYGSKTANKRVYGASSPPEYHLWSVTAPVFLYYSESDSLADVNNVNKLGNQLVNIMGMFRVPDFNHYDYLFGTHARKFVYNILINVIEDYYHPSNIDKKQIHNQEYEREW